MPGPGARDRSKQSRKMKSFERDGDSPDDRMAKVRADEEAKATAGKRVTQADMDAERAQADAATAEQEARDEATRLEDAAGHPGRRRMQSFERTREAEPSEEAKLAKGRALAARLEGDVARVGSAPAWHASEAKEQVGPAGGFVFSGPQYGAEQVKAGGGGPVFMPGAPQRAVEGLTAADVEKQVAAYRARLQAPSMPGYAGQATGGKSGR